MERLTDEDYWERGYNCKQIQPPIGIHGIRNHSNRLILDVLLKTNLENKRVLEVGAGDSAWLPYLAERFPSSRFVGLDYSESGCRLLSERVWRMGVNIEVVREDFFAEDSRLHGMFDTVISFGVVEHFDDLSHVLSAKRKYIKHGGVLFTIIPNMAGVMGLLARRWNRTVYDKHNPHDLGSFFLGHRQAGLEIVLGGYLCSINFGVLSSCFPERRGLPWQINRMLVGATLGIWTVETVAGNLPTSKMFSPYIYAISRTI